MSATWAVALRVQVGNHVKSVKLRPTAGDLGAAAMWQNPKKTRGAASCDSWCSLIMEA